MDLLTRLCGSARILILSDLTLPLHLPVLLNIDTTRHLTVQKIHSCSDI